MAPKNVHKAITICLPDDKGVVDRSTGIKFAFKGLWHLAGYLTTVGLRNPHVTASTSDVFQRPCFIGGWGDDKIAGAEERGLALSVAIFDYDEGVTLESAEALYHLPYERFFWTTRSCRDTELHFRIAVAINQPITHRDELVAMTTRLNHMLGGGIKMIKNLNHPHDVPLASAACHYEEGTLFDLAGLMAVNHLFVEEGIPAEIESDLPTIQSHGGPTAVARHWDHLAGKQLQRLLDMQVGSRNDTCASAAATIGAAFAAASKDISIDEEEILDLIEQMIRSHQTWGGETDKFVSTARKQFAWGKEHPFDDMGVTHQIDELMLAVLRLKEHQHTPLDAAIATCAALQEMIVDAH